MPRKNPKPALKNMAHRRTGVYVCGIALLCALGVATFAADNGLLSEFENRVLDNFFKFRSTLPTSSDIVLVDIDDQSIEKLGRWPWDRTYHARMIRILSQAGAAVIGYDVLFNQSATEEEDRALSEAMREARNVVLPTGYELESGGAMMSVTREVGPLPEIRRAAAGIGHISANRDPDGVIRRVPLLVRAQDRIVPAFSLALLTGFYHARPEDLALHPSSRVVIQGGAPGSNGRNGDRRIKVGTEAMLLVNFAGTWHETFNHYSFADLLKAWDTQEGRQQLPLIMKGKICIVSNAATGYDLKPVPLEKDFPGGGIHANALNTILTGQYLSTPDDRAMFVIILSLSLFAAVAAVTTTWWIGLLSIALLCVVYFGLAFYSFTEGVVLQTLSPLVAGCLSYSFGLIYQNQRIKYHMRRLTEETRELGVALAAVTTALRDKETLLDTRQEELSNLTYDIDGLQGQEKGNLERIEALENLLKEAAREKEALVEQLRALEERTRDLLVEAIPKPKTTVEVERLQKAFGIVTRDRAVLQRLERAKRTLTVNNPILIQGETGTGKDLFARAIHKMGPRANKAFVTVNIPGIPDNLIESDLFGHVKGSFTSAVSDRKGKFQLADQGTIFLDEIGEMRPELQAKLLRVLETGEVDRIGATSLDRVDVAIIAATNRDLRAEVENRRFREDLYFRINATTLTLPPLRERQDDIELLADYFLRRFALESGRPVTGITVKAMRRLKSYHWRGNIRELRNVIRKGVALAEGDRITEDDLELEEPASTTRPAHGPIGDGFLEKLDAGGVLSDRDMLVSLRKNGFDIGEAADLLGVARNTVGTRLKGICFMVLAEAGLDFKRAARIVAGEAGSVDVLEKRIQEYYGNLVKAAQQYQTGADATAETRRRAKNLPQKYFEGMDRLIKDYFDHRTGNA